MNQPTESKTILDWFEEARTAGHQWADAAIENAWAAGTAEITGRPALRSALCAAFIWEKTTQGHEFWYNVYDTLRRNP